MKPASLLSLLAFLMPVAPAAEIPKNTHVLLRMVNSISTRTAQEGAQVYMQTASPISDGRQIIVPVGSYVQGTVLVAKRSGKVAGRAQLAIRLEVLTLPGGKTLKFSPHVSGVDDAETTQKVVNDEGLIEQGNSTLASKAGTTKLSVRMGLSSWAGTRGPLSLVIGTSEWIWPTNGRPDRTLALSGDLQLIVFALRC